MKRKKTQDEKDAEWEQTKAQIKQLLKDLVPSLTRSAVIMGSRAATVEALNLRTSTDDWPTNGTSPLCQSLVRELRAAQDNMDYLVTGALSTLDTALTKLDKLIGYAGYAKYCSARRRIHPQGVRRVHGPFAWARAPTLRLKPRKVPQTG